MSLMRPIVLITLLLAVGGLAPRLLACDSCPAHADAGSDSGADQAGAAAASGSDATENDTETAAPPTLEESMETLKGALRKIKRGAYGDNLSEAHVTQVDRAIAAVTSASRIMPSTASTDALQQAYRQQMQAVLTTLQSLKTAVQQADAAQTKQILKKLDQQEDQGHDQFREEEE